MAGIMEILLKLRGDGSEAVRMWDDQTKAAKRTEDQTEKVRQKIAQTRREAAAGGSGRGSDVAGIGMSSEMLGGRISSIVGMFAAVLEGFQRVTGWLDQNFPVNRQADVGLASSAADTAKRLTSAGGFQWGDLADWRNLLGRGHLFGNRKQEDERVKAQIDALAKSDPAQLADAIDLLPDKYAGYAIKQIGMNTAAQAYQSSLKGRISTAGGYQTVNNIHIGIVGDPNAAGRAIRQTTDRRDRNNGQAASTTRRR